jgi:hypothetical protein
MCSQVKGKQFLLLIKLIDYHSRPRTLCKLKHTLTICWIRLISPRFILEIGSFIFLINRIQDHNRCRQSVISLRLGFRRNFLSVLKYTYRCIRLDGPDGQNCLGNLFRFGTLSLGYLFRCQAIWPTCFYIYKLIYIL